MREWFESWFGEEYVALYPHRDAADAEAAIELIERTVPSDPHARVLDLACGGGRHSKLLSHRWLTTGLDLSPVLLRYARKQAPDAQFVRGDMRVLPFRDSTFALVANLFTSFGYFADDKSHQSVITEVARVTAKGGTFVLDFLNTEHIRETLVPYDERDIGGRVVGSGARSRMMAATSSRGYAFAARARIHRTRSPLRKDELTAMRSTLNSA